jgi:3(or 17)beta-hydroxysteroid dehydrogenase
MRGSEQCVCRAKWRSRAHREFGRLDVLVLTAVCDVPLGPVTGLTLADWRRTMAVNLDAAFLFCKHAIPRHGSGSIILIASQLGRVARSGRPTAPPRGR